MAFDLGEKLRALWKLQPWYLWAGEGLAVGSIAYIAITNRQASQGATADTLVPPAPQTPPGEAPAPGSSAGASPPEPLPVLPPSPIQPGAQPPSPLQPPAGNPGNPGGIGNPGTMLGLRQPPAAPGSGSGSGGKTGLLAHAFADAHVPSEWHERHQQLDGGSNLLPFHTGGEY